MTKAKKKTEVTKISNPKSEKDVSDKEKSNPKSAENTLSGEQVEGILKGDIPCHNEMSSYFRNQILEFRSEFQKQFQVLQGMNAERNKIDQKIAEATKNLDGIGGRLQGLIFDLNQWFHKK